VRWSADVSNAAIPMSNETDQRINGSTDRRMKQLAVGRTVGLFIGSIVAGKGIGYSADWAVSPRTLVGVQTSGLSVIRNTFEPAESTSRGRRSTKSNGDEISEQITDQRVAAGKSAAKDIWHPWTLTSLPATP